MVAGGSRGGDDAQVPEPVEQPPSSATTVPAEAQAEAPASPAPTEPPAPAAGRVVHEFTGSALTSNLIPPPDCYAE